MFSKEDYVKYFLQIRNIEVKMKEKFGAYAGAVDDPALKRFFSDLERQERAHERIVDSMVKEFSN